METRYPWEGAVRLTVEEATGARGRSPSDPEWSGRAAVRVNGARHGPPDGHGYLRLERLAAGDTVGSTSMDARLIEPHPAIEATRGCLPQARPSSTASSRPTRATRPSPS
jgi:DUF1680 family protein